MTVRPASWCSALAFAVSVWSPALAAAASLIDWEPVTEAELRQAQSLVEPGADAEIVFHHEWVEDQFSNLGISQTRQIYVRVKILTAAGAQTYSTISIDFSRRSSHVSEVRARTILPDGTVIPLDKRAVIQDVVVRKGREGVMRKSFAMPGVQPGCLVEYRYRLDVDDTSISSLIYKFQSNIPTQKLVFHIKPVEAPDWFVRTQLFHTSATASPKRVDGYMEFTALNQPSYVEEPDSPPELQERGWMMMFYTQEPLQSPEVYWPRLGRRLAREFELSTRPNAPSKRLAASLTDAAPNEDAKLDSLLQWLRTRFTVVYSNSSDAMKARHLRPVDTGPAAIAQSGGTPIAANLALATLTRASGLETRLLRVASCEDFFFAQGFMLHEGFIPNVQLAVRLDGVWRSLDAGQRYLGTDMLPWSQESQLGLFCDPDSSHFIATSVAAASRSKCVRVAELALSENGDVEGDIRLQLTGHWNDEVRALLESLPGEDSDSTLFRDVLRMNGIELSRVRVARGASERAPLEIHGHVRVREHATATATRLLVQPAVFQAHEPPRFTSGSRVHPVNFEYAWTELDTVRLRLPPGWVPEAIDSPEPVHVPDIADFSAQLSVRTDGAAIEFTRSLEFGTAGELYFPVREYPTIKRLFDLVRERDHSTVSLVRKDARP